MIKFKKTELAKDLEHRVNYTDASQEVGTMLDFTPVRATEGSSGYDLKACIEEPLIISPYEVVKIPTGVHIWIGDMTDVQSDDIISFAGLYMPRSSNPGLKLTNTIGLLDADYQGQSFLKYENTTSDCITINPGDKIGQLVIIPTYIGSMLEVDGFDSETVRAEGGFGSTDRGIGC